MAPPALLNRSARDSTTSGPRVLALPARLKRAIQPPSRPYRVGSSRGAWLSRCPCFPPANCWNCRAQVLLLGARACSGFRSGSSDPELAATGESHREADGECRPAHPRHLSQPRRHAAGCVEVWHPPDRMRVPFAAVAAALLFAAMACAASGASGSKPQLKLVRGSVHGSHFASRELVRLSFVGPAPRAQRRVHSSATGRFAAALPDRAGPVHGPARSSSRAARAATPPG